eukprot:TRINITY_DN722_c0_g1_i3.p1 TRINITY_DN722_c0_g1~~TRINITY_DN722_c0_g1_i3.p1  ORF type:complete len:201 (-),score=25.55 TRINITY_DN722_c0_g1_i3:140-742(-)
MNNDIVTGISIVTLSPKEFDKGKILIQKELPISPTMMHSELRDILSTLGAQYILHSLENYDTLIKGAKEQQGKPIMSKKFYMDDGKVDWSQKNVDIYSKWRALSDLGFIHTFRAGKGNSLIRIKILSMELVDSNDSPILPSEIEYGTVLYEKSKKSLFIKCGQGWIRVSSVKPDSKNIMSAHNYALGFNLLKKGNFTKFY